MEAIADAGMANMHIATRYGRISEFIADVLSPRSPVAYLHHPVDIVTEVTDHQV